MVLIVVAGCIHCAEFAHADYLADFLSQRLPNFEYHRIALEREEWVNWLKAKNKENDWSYWKSPLIWRETAMRGGIAELVGGLHEFFEYCYEYYGICSFLSQEEKKLLVEENIKENERAKEAKKLWDKERLSHENQAAAIIVGAFSAGRTLGILLAELLTVKIVKKVVLWEEDRKKREYLTREMEEIWHLGPIIIQKSLKGVLYTACLVIVLQIPDPRKHMKGRHPSTRFNLKLCKCAKATLWLAEKLREGNNLPAECRFVVAIGPLACFSAAVLAEALSDRLDPRSVVAVTADPELLPQVASTRWSLQPSVWGWPGVTHLVDVLGAKVGVAWFEPTRRALKKIAHSSLPQGKWHAEIRQLRCVPEIQQLTAVPNKDKNKKSQSRHLSIATLRAIMNVVHLWLADVGFAAEEIISLGIFSDGTHNLPKGLVFSQPAILDCSGFWSPCETVLPPSEGPVRLPDILPIPLRVTATFGLGKCMQAIWTLPTDEKESVLEKEKVAVECISKEDQKIKDWLEMYTLLDKYEESVTAEIERIAVSTEARYRWLSLSERLPEEQVIEDEHTSNASGSDNSLLNNEKVSDEHREQSEKFMEEVCELHFQTHNIERIQTVTDSKTGETYTVLLERTRLKKDTVLTQMSDCPTHLSTSTSRSEDRRKRLENSQFRSTISESVAIQTEYLESVPFKSLCELKDMISVKCIVSGSSKIMKIRFSSFL